MKRKYFVLVIICLILFSVFTSCKPDTAAAPKEADQTQNKAERPAESDRATSPSDDMSAEELPIDISILTDGDDIKWDRINYQYKEYSFEMPENWQVIDGVPHGLVDGIFLVPPDTDMENFRFSAHVAIELIGAAPEGADIPDFSNSGIQKEFFASQIISTYSKMGGLSDLEFYVWESAQYYTYIAQFMRSNDQLSMYQTTYDVMNPKMMFIVQATHFGEEADPEVNEVARHLINTFL